jgi:hypothetical protein
MLQDFSVKARRNKTCKRLRYGCEDNIKTDVREVGCGVKPVLNVLNFCNRIFSIIY